MLSNKRNNQDHSLARILSLPRILISTRNSPRRSKSLLRATIILKCCLLLVVLPLVCSELVPAQTSRRGKTQRPAAKTQTSPEANKDFEQYVKRGDEARLAQR